MTRWKLTIEYFGTPFVGWQRQDNGLSVQEVLETALQRLTGAGCPTEVAGRTDAGVHALGQVAHVDLDPRFEARAVRDGTNHHLGDHPVAVLSAERVPDDFSARRWALSRRYRYVIRNRRAPLTIDRDRAWHCPRPLDAEVMAEAARHLIGHHDFSTFRASQCQAASPMRTLDNLTVRRVDDTITIDAVARSFLHHQIRNIAGTLYLVGLGGWTPDDVRRALEGRDRRLGGPTAPPQGLYFVGVDYPA